MVNELYVFKKMILEKVKPLSMSRKIIQKIDWFKEFHKASDCQKKSGIPVTAFTTRNKDRHLEDHLKFKEIVSEEGYQKQI